MIELKGVEYEEPPPNTTQEIPKEIPPSRNKSLNRDTRKSSNLLCGYLFRGRQLPNRSVALFNLYNTMVD